MNGKTVNSIVGLLVAVCIWSDLKIVVCSKSYHGIFQESTTATYWPTGRTTWYPPSTTCPPSRISSSPKFTKTIYQSFLPSWPTAGTAVHLNINASTEDNVPLQYELVSPFEYLTMSLAMEIVFTKDVAENSYVGPNNVMIIEVIATALGDSSRSGSATVVLVFPRISKREEDAEMGL